MNMWLIFGMLLMIIGAIVVMLSLRHNRSTGIVLIGPIPIIISNKPYLFMITIIVIVILFMVMLLV